LSAPDAPSQRIAALDGVRGLAILSVLTWHCAGEPLSFLLADANAAAAAPFWQLALARLLKLGASGVPLFFALSGFLIGGILLDQRESPRFFSAFYWRRAGRILPLYVTTVVAFFALRAALPRLVDAPGYDRLLGEALPAWTYATFTQNFAMAERATWQPDWLMVTWSLAIEEQFYLVLPLLVRFLSPRVLFALLAGMVVTAPLWRAGTTDLGVVLLPMQADALLLGVFAAWGLRTPAVRAWLSRAWPLLRGALVVLLIGLGAYAGSAFVPDHGSPVWTVLAWTYALIVLLAATGESGPLERLYTARWLRALGRWAYGIYLIHTPILGLAHAKVFGRPPSFGSGREVGVTLAAAAVAIGLAALSWRFFERPLVDWGRARGAYAGGRPKK
jgi:peptidoglycan/LPS O-acetylase OafA/YrhL